MEATPRDILICQDESGREPFTEWLDSLDVQTRARVRVRIDRLEDGLFGDVKPIGEGISELRLDFGPGYRVYDLAGKEIAKGSGPGGNDVHTHNFVDAVRGSAKLNAEIEEGAISTALVHLGNISYRLGRSVHFDAASYSCVGDKEANAMFSREYRKPFVVPQFA